MKKYLISALCFSAFFALHNYVGLMNYKDSQNLLIGDIESLANNENGDGEQTAKYDVVDCPSGHTTQQVTAISQQQGSSSQTTENSEENKNSTTGNATASVKFLGNGGSASTGYTGTWTDSDSNSQTNSNTNTTTTQSVVTYSGEGHSVACVPNGSQYDWCTAAPVHVKTASCIEPGHYGNKRNF